MEQALTMIETTGDTEEDATASGYLKNVTEVK
jgi:hypothetical protein